MSCQYTPKSSFIVVITAYRQSEGGIRSWHHSFYQGSGKIAMEMEEAAQRSHELPSPNVVLLPPPTLLGHLIPFVELAKKLVLEHKCSATIIVPNDGTLMAPQKSLLQGLPHGIRSFFLPRVSTDDIPEDINVEVLLTILIIRSLPLLWDALASLKEMGTPAAALVMDLFGPHAIEVAKEFSIPAYIYYVAAANELSVSINMPVILEQLGDSCKQPIMLPGSIVVEPEDIPVWYKERNSEVHKWAIDLGKRFRLPDGIIVNSFLELESQAFEELNGGGGQLGMPLPPINPVGPLIRTGLESQSHECLRWLDDQPSESVVFVSFGSGATLSVEQFHELALGLEMCGQRFLWVVRCPQENVAAAYLGGKAIEKDPLMFLPDGFLERTKGRGLVVASWVPQIKVLSHEAVGGFVTHCGWNSILEGTVHGVPMIAWPLCFEQKMNAVFLTEELKGATRVKDNGNGIVEKEHFSTLVKGLM